MANLIALVGQKQSGKDTCYRLLAKLHKTIHRFALADELKKEVALLMHTTPEAIEEQKTLWRSMLQWYGTEYVKTIIGLPYYWCEKLEDEIEKRLPTNHVGIITDMRFLDEYKYFSLRNNLVVINVIRPSINLEIKDQHRSEVELLHIPYHLQVVNTDLNQLEEQIHDAYIEACNWFDSGNIPRAEPLIK